MKLFPSKPGRNTITSYGLIGTASLALDLICTRLFYPGCRLMRRPHYIRGRRWIALGPGFTCGRGLRMDAFGTPASNGPLIHVGTQVAVNDYVHIAAVASVTIGDRVLIASKVFISDHDHGCYGKGGIHSSPRTPPGDRDLSATPIVIEDDVWLGEFVSVLPGVRIGKGSIIGTMSTVTRDIPPYSIAVGSPARVIKQYSFENNRWERV